MVPTVRGGPKATEGLPKKNNVALTFLGFCEGRVSAKFCGLTPSSLRSLAFPHILLKVF